MSDSTIGQIDALRRMSVAQLRAEWERLYGEPTRSRNRTFLWRRLAWRVQELAHGGLSDDARDRLDGLAQDGFRRARPPSVAPIPAATRRDARLPRPGSTITREYHGRELHLLVREDGFELDGQAFGSLSEAARHVTGARWNGPLFWGLTKRKRKS